MDTISNYVNVTKQAVKEYREKMPVLLDKVNSEMKILNDQFDLIGDNPESLMIDNHDNHGQFMTTVFELNNYDLLENTLPWVLDSYLAKGFSKQYFEYELNAWIDAIDTHFEVDKNKEIINNYQAMLYFVIHREDKKMPKIIEDYPYDDKCKAIKDEFTMALIEGDYNKAIEITKELVQSEDDLSKYYDQIVKYAMYDIGSMWQKNIVSISQEHLATSIVMRIMSYFYTSFTINKYDKGKAIITAAANEMHEVGARIVADSLEIDGWDITYIGSNTPIEDLVGFIRREKPFFVGVSVTMTYNLDNARALIERIRAYDDIKDTKVIVGGFALKYCEEQINIGQDALINDVNELVHTAGEWWSNGFSVE